MSRVQDMLRTHPVQSQVDMATLAACIEACFDCAQTCTACADACLGESKVKKLVRCIRLNLDCADVCEPTGRIVSRQTAVEASLWRDQLQAYITACEGVASSANNTPVCMSIAGCAPKRAATVRKLAAAF